jgi:hypothetical protein
VDYWFHGDRTAGREDFELQAAAMGLTLPDEDPEPDDFEVWAEHEDALMTFMRCQTQWRAGTSAGVMGLDYGVVFEMMRLYAVSNRCAVMEDLQVMEMRGMELLNERARQAQENGR